MFAQAKLAGGVTPQEGGGPPAGQLATEVYNSATLLAVVNATLKLLGLVIVPQLLGAGLPVKLPPDKVSTQA